jgi:hypothetical protein
MNSAMAFYFNHDAWQIVTESLTEMGVQFDPSLPLDKLLVLLATVSHRRIAAIPREVHFSVEFIRAKEGLPEQLQRGADEVVRKLRQGLDVNSHLNRRSVEPERDDDLLADWGVHHFHLGDERGNGDAFSARTDLLAFAHLTGTDAYFIDILPHQNFDQPQLLETFVRRFPAVAERFEVKGILGASQVLPATVSDIRTLRKGHVNSLMAIDGKFYFGPGGGLVASGHSARAVYLADAALARIADLERTMLRDEARIRKQIASAKKTDAALLDFELVSYENQWRVYEKTTRSLLILDGDSPKPGPAGVRTG